MARTADSPAAPRVSPPDLPDEFAEAQPARGADLLAARLDLLRAERGLRLVATVTDPDAEPIDRFERPPRLAIVMGSEAHGLDPDWITRCDSRVTIPMRPGAESLNVAVAAGIFLHHLTRDPR